MKRISTFVGTLTLLLALLVNVVPVSAQTSQTSSGLSITPRKNLIIKPGETINDKLNVGNLNRNASLEITFRTVDFTFMNESGTPKLNLAQDAPQTPWSLKPFLTLPKTIVIPPGESRAVDYSIKIPTNQGAGSYYSAIQYGTGGTDGGNVNLSASGVSLVFVSVPGIVNEKMDLKKFGAYTFNQDETAGSFTNIATKVPTYMAYTLQNNGNVAESPAGNISIKYMFGGKKWDIDTINPRSALALIGQSRLFTTCIEAEKRKVVVNDTSAQEDQCKTPKMWPGLYKANINVFYGQNGNATHEISGSSHFWYLPIWFLIALAVVLATLAFVIFKIVRKIKGASRRPSSGGAYRKRR